MNSNIKTECFDYKHYEKGGRYERQRFKQNFLKQSNYNIMLITENKQSTKEKLRGTGNALVAHELR